VRTLAPSARNAALFLLGSVTACILLGAVFTLAAIRDTQVSNTHKGTSDSATLDRINDCTQPGGECFREGQKRTAEAVGQFVTSDQAAAAAAAWCASHHPEWKFPQVYTCTVRLSTAVQSRSR
jgi:hypothetical protein